MAFKGEKGYSPLHDETVFYSNLIPFSLPLGVQAKFPAEGLIKTASSGAIQGKAVMMKAENALLDNYKNACHIRWPEMGDAYVDEARKVAEATLLPYSEIWGSSAYLAELLHGGQSGERFLHLVPGQTIDMDVEGTICAVACPA